MQTQVTLIDIEKAFERLPVFSIQREYLKNVRKCMLDRGLLQMALNDFEDAYGQVAVQYMQP